jgi:hypothetical protein
VKTLHVPKPCKVLLHRQSVRAVHYRERAWVVRDTLCVYTLCDPWRTLPDLTGEKRVYHQLFTAYGEIMLFERIRGLELGWFIAGWWD